jgi:hypothetical protein
MGLGMGLGWYWDSYFNFRWDWDGIGIENFVNSMLYFKLVKQSANYDEAEKICNSYLRISDLSFAPTLASIKTSTQQQFLNDYIFNISGAENNVWLGAERVGEKNEFMWNDGSSLDYNNWVEGSPTNDSRRNCLVMQSAITYRSDDIGKWKDITCANGNWILCQKLQMWSFPQLQKSFLDSRNLLKETRERLEDNEHQLSETKYELSAAKNEIQITKDELRDTKKNLSETNSELIDTKLLLVQTVNELKSINYLQNIMINNHISGKFKSKIFIYPKSRAENIGTFSKCQSVCNKYNATTIKIHSEEEDNFVFNFINNFFNHTSNNDQVWLGGKIFDPTSNLVWLDGSTVDYTSWGSGQPDHDFEKCVTIWGEAKFWNNFLCESYSTTQWITHIACEIVL